MRLSWLSESEFRCSLDRPLTTLLPDNIRVYATHMFLYVPNQNETLTTNIFILSLMKEAPKIKRVSPIKLFQGQQAEVNI